MFSKGGGESLAGSCRVPFLGKVRVLCSQEKFFFFFANHHFPPNLTNSYFYKFQVSSFVFVSDLLVPNALLCK